MADFTKMSKEDLVAGLNGIRKAGVEKNVVPDVAEKSEQDPEIPRWADLRKTLKGTQMSLTPRDPDDPDTQLEDFTQVDWPDLKARSRMNDEKIKNLSHQVGLMQNGLKNHSAGASEEAKGCQQDAINRKLDQINQTVDENEGFRANISPTPEQMAAGNAHQAKVLAERD